MDKALCIGERAQFAIHLFNNLWTFYESLLRVESCANFMHSCANSYVFESDVKDSIRIRAQTPSLSVIHFYEISLIVSNVIQMLKNYAIEW